MKIFLSSFLIIFLSFYQIFAQDIEPLGRSLINFNQSSLNIGIGIFAGMSVAQNIGTYDFSEQLNSTENSFEIPSFGGSLLLNLYCPNGMVDLIAKGNISYGKVELVMGNYDEVLNYVRIETPAMMRLKFGDLTDLESFLVMGGVSYTKYISSESKLTGNPTVFSDHINIVGGIGQDLQVFAKEGNSRTNIELLYSHPITGNISKDYEGSVNQMASNASFSLDSKKSRVGFFSLSVNMFFGR